MKKTFIISIAVLFVFTFVPMAICAETAKIGVFSFQKVLTESSAGKLSQKRVRARGKELQQKLKAEKKKIDEMQKNFEREALVLSPEKQKEKQRDFRIRVNDFKRMQEDFAKEFKRLEVSEINKIKKAVFQIINQIGKQEGYLLILEQQSAGVIYHPDRIDITDKIIKTYNLQISKTKK
jgi:outer membrane protein